MRYNLLRSCSRNQKTKWMAVFLLASCLALIFVLASRESVFAQPALPTQVQMIEADENGNFSAVFKVPIPNGQTLNENKNNVAGDLGVGRGPIETTVTMSGNLVNKAKGGEWQVMILNKVPNPTIYQVVRLLITPKGSLVRMTKGVAADLDGNFPGVSFIINKPQVDAKITDTTKDNVVGLFGPGLAPANGGAKTEVVVGPGKLADPKKPGRVVVYVDPPGTYFELTLDISPSVGGIVEFPQIEEPGAAIPDFSGHDHGAPVGIIAGAAVGVIMLISAAWYIRRRRTKATR